MCIRDRVNTFLNAAGYEIGKSLYEKDLVETSKELIEQAKKNNCNILLPDDVSTGNKFEENTAAEIKLISDIDKNDIIMDIGPKTIKKLNHNFLLDPSRR